MKKLISLILALCVALTMASALADGAAGVWYGDYHGAVMTLTLAEDGTCSMEVSGFQMGAGTWAEKDGAVEITMTDMTGGASTLIATLADGVLTLADEDMSVDFTQEAPEIWAPADVNPEAAAEDFDGSWAIAKVNTMGMLVDASAAGMGEMTLNIENGVVTFGGNASSITFFIGDAAIPLNYADGTLSYSIDIANDAMALSFQLQAVLLQDGMLSVSLDMGYGETVMYFTRVAAEEAPAA